MDNTGYKKLVIVRWASREAVYLEGVLVHFGEGGRGGWGLLNSLGYECQIIFEIPTHYIPREFSTDDRGWWVPPASLKVLEDQQRQYTRRMCLEDIATTKQHLNELLEKVRAMEYSS